MDDDAVDAYLGNVVASDIDLGLLDAATENAQERLLGHPCRAQRSHSARACAQRVGPVGLEKSQPAKVEPLRQLLDGPQLAHLLHTTERHLRRLVAERRIPFVRVGRFIRFDTAAIGRWLEYRATTEGDFAS